jgi:hypothetical protein
MREYSPRVVKVRVTNGCSLTSIDDYIEGRTHLSEEEEGYAPSLLARSKSARENRLHRVAELIEGERHLAGRVDARVDRHGAYESAGERNQTELGVRA